MKKLLLCISLLAAFMPLCAQTADQTPFKGYLFNKEHDVFMRINFYEQDVVITWQELCGPLPGFLAKNGNSYCWIVSSADIHDNRAELVMVNDTGSEDLTARLTQQNDSTYTLQQLSGSPIKVSVNGKLRKLPQNLVFIRKNAGR